jgi:hypothetical protein
VIVTRTLIPAPRPTAVTELEVVTVLVTAPVTGEKLKAVGTVSTPLPETRATPKGWRLSFE